MKTPEIKVGQKYRVVDALGFGCPMGSRPGDILEIDYCKDTDPESWRASNPSLDVRGEVIFYPEDITSGFVELVEDIQESHEDAPVFEQCQVWKITDDYTGDVRKGDHVYISTAEILFGDTEAVAHNITNTDATVILYESDVYNGRIKKVADSLYEYFTGEPLEASDEVTEAPSTNVPEEAEDVSQASTGTPQEILDAAHTCVGVSRSSVDSSEGIHMYKNTNHTDDRSGHSAELIWKFIEGSSEYNQHKQFEIAELSFESLKEVVESLGEYLESDRDIVANTLEIRLMYNGNYGGKYSGTWGASVYRLDYWDSGEHPCGHTDRLLLSVDVVKGI